MVSKTGKRMVIMLAIVAVLVAALVGFNLFKAHMIEKAMASMANPVQTVSADTASLTSWQPMLETVATLRAARGADLALDAAGVVSEVAIASGQEVASGDLILRLRDDDNRAALDQARAALALANLSFERAQKQIKTRTIAQAAFDDASADLQAKRAAVAQQQALLEKKTLRAPFDGRAGIITLSPGTYLNAGTPVVTLQQLDPILANFSLPQRQLPQLAVGARVHLQVDGHPGTDFLGTLTAINPKVDPETRNVLVEASIANPDGLLQPGMFAHASVEVGVAEQRLTLPQTAITYNPYGATVFLVRDETGTDDAGKPVTRQVVQQTFITAGDTRGDQVAITRGLEAGDLVVTSGQLKLKNGTPLVINNSHQPANDPAPRPQEH